MQVVKINFCDSEHSKWLLTIVNLTVSRITIRIVHKNLSIVQCKHVRETYVHYSLDKTTLNASEY